MLIKKLLIVIMILSLVSVTALIMPLALAFGRSGRDTKVLGKDYSMLTKDEILNKLELDFPMSGNLLLTDQGQNFEIKLSSISAKIDQSKMLSNLLYRRINQGLFKYVRAFFEKKYFSLEITLNDQALAEEIQKITSQIEKPFIPTELVIENGIKLREGQLGRKVVNSQLQKEILRTLNDYSMGSYIEIPFEIIGFLPTETEKESMVEQAEKLVNENVNLVWDGQTSGLEKEVFINWLGFRNNCNNENIAEYVNNFGKSVKKEPRDAVFKFEGGKVIEFEPAKNGYWVDEKKLVSILCEGLTLWPKDDKNEIQIEVPLIVMEPKIKTDEVNDMGIKELLGKGSSSFRHSSEIRNYNVEKGSSIINRILVAPDEIFSFVNNLGEVTLEAGYKKAYIIRAGKTELDVGGGICQVSTTLFRAIIDAGLPIVERKAHAYRVSYYEEDSKPGFDATVFIPSPDLKFKNDTGHYLLIQSTYDGTNKKLTYEIYGSSDGRKSEISNYRQWDASPAPPDVWIDDPTLPPGKVVQDEHKIPGLKTSFDWKVTRDGEVIHQRTFVSSYVPWAAVYRRGPSL